MNAVAEFEDICKKRLLPSNGRCCIAREWFIKGADSDDTFFDVADAHGLRDRNPVFWRVDIESHWYKLGQEYRKQAK